MGPGQKWNITLIKRQGHFMADKCVQKINGLYHRLINEFNIHGLFIRFEKSVTCKPWIHPNTVEIHHKILYTEMFKRIGSIHARKSCAIAKHERLLVGFTVLFRPWSSNLEYSYQYIKSNRINLQYTNKRKLQSDPRNLMNLRMP